MRSRGFEMVDMKPKKCRHSGTWLIAGGNYEWCYGCGSFRRCLSNGVVVIPTTQWTKPTGEGGKNPWPMKKLKSREEVSNEIDRA